MALRPRPHGPSRLEPHAAGFSMIKFPSSSTLRPDFLASTCSEGSQTTFPASGPPTKALKSSSLRRMAPLQAQVSPPQSPRVLLAAGVGDVVRLANVGVAGEAVGHGAPPVDARPRLLDLHLELVGPLPRELGAWIDMATAVSARSQDPDRALAFIRYITRTDATPVWTDTSRPA